MRQPSGAHHIARWLWTDRSFAARVIRAGLVPLSGLYALVMAVRSAAYRAGVFPRRELGTPSIGIGNLSVGGSGKTPLASWIAAYCLERGARPGVVLRDWGSGDEARVHERSVPGAVVVAFGDRVQAAAVARERGANLVILDDAYQRIDLRPTLNVAVMAAETSKAARWLLPAGPWREGRRALRRADLLVVTRKRAGFDVAEDLVRRLGPWLGETPTAICHLGIVRLQGMVTGEALEPTVVDGHRVLASAGIANPKAFASQLRAFGADVQLVGWDDHHRYRADEIDWLVQLSDRADYVIITEKDAVKLRGHWPADRQEPLVAVLGLSWERGLEHVERAVRETLRLAT